MMLDMDVLLGKVTQQAVNYAIRSGIAVTASYAIRQSSKLLAAAPKSRVRDEVDYAQLRLQHKIRIISPAIDMIELIAARGNTSLESAITLTQELRREIQNIGQRLAQGAENAAKLNKLDRVSSQAQAEHEAEMYNLRDEVRMLIKRIDDAVPLINLAITTSGVTLSATLPSTVSPSRLLQASTFLTAGDTHYCQNPDTAVQIGPTFFLTVYMLFAGHSRPQNEEEIRETTWKEVMHKARVKLRRVPLDVILDTGTGSNAIPSIEIHSQSSEPSPSNLPAENRQEEYGYQLMIIEDLDDDRVHDWEEDQPQAGPFDDVGLAGIREMIPIHEISKIFYADTGKVLNISADAETNHPVLLLKRDLNAIPPRRMVERENEDAEQPTKPESYVQHHDRDDPWRLPPSLDPEWIAFEVYTGEDDDETPSSSPTRSTSLDPEQSVGSSMSKLSLDSRFSQQTTPAASTTAASAASPASAKTLIPTSQPPWVNALPTSLSLLELLLRLCSLQQFQQQSHLSITDELLNFFLEEAASTGAGGDEHYRQEVRREARRRVGWDPYDESPIKRRGEDYQYHYQDHDHDHDHDQHRYPPSGGSGRYGGGRYDSPGVSYLSNVVRNSSSPVAAAPPTPTSNSATATATGAAAAATEDQSSSSSGGVVVSSNSASSSPAGGGAVPVAKAPRPDWLRQRMTGSSPLRPTTGRSDEGLGTSPLTGRQPRQ